MARLIHENWSEKTVQELQKEADDWLAEKPAPAMVADLLLILRHADLPWWQPEDLHSEIPERIAALHQRPDIRQRIMQNVAGLPPKTALEMNAGLQSTILLTVLSAGDVSVPELDEAFSPQELVTYMDAGTIWRRFRDKMPWEEQTTTHTRLVGAIMRALLAQRKSRNVEVRVLTAHELISAIDRMKWQTHLPAEIRAQIDAALLHRELGEPRRPFHAKDILEIATPEAIAEQIPLIHLKSVIDAADRAMNASEPDGRAEEGDTQSLDVVRPSLALEGTLSPKA